MTYTMPPPSSVYLLFDERMGLHHPLHPSSALEERPERIFAIFSRLVELERRLTSSLCPVDVETAFSPFFNRRLIPLPCKPVDRETALLVHTPEHYQRLYETSSLSDDELIALDVESDLYFCHDTFLAASLACGGVVECVNAVTEAFKNGYGPTRAIAVVRPPGHHALADSAMGFCYFNNLAVGAKHAIATGRARRVFILDWDIHHGNGTQDLTYTDPNIFYLSLHRASFKTNSKHWFYPGTGRPNEVGNKQEAAGTNLNIVWGQGGMGDVEYAAAFSEVVLPVLSSFGPDLILIGAGYDAAKGDLLGDCGLTPEMYYIMMNSVLEAAGRRTPVVCVQEGGYNLDVIATCSEAVALALLDEPWHKMGHVSESDDALRSSTILECGENGAHYCLDRYWKREAKAKEQIGEGQATKHALACIKKSAKAIAKQDMTSFGSVNCLAPPPSYLYAREMEVSKPFHRLSLIECDRYPIKKRRIRHDMDYSNVLYQLSDL